MVAIGTAFAAERFAKRRLVQLSAGTAALVAAVGTPSEQSAAENGKIVQENCTKCHVSPEPQIVAVAAVRFAAGTRSAASEMKEEDSSFKINDKHKIKIYLRDELLLHLRLLDKLDGLLLRHELHRLLNELNIISYLPVHVRIVGIVIRGSSAINAPPVIANFCHLVEQSCVRTNERILSTVRLTDMERLASRTQICVISRPLHFSTVEGATRCIPVNGKFCLWFAVRVQARPTVPVVFYWMVEVPNFCIK